MAGFTRTVFLGATVRSFNSSIGWGGQSSQLTVSLVVDPLNGDSFNPPTVGSPVYFQFYGFTFNGLLQKYEERRGADGDPVFEVIVTDPREILDGCQVILACYSGVTGGVDNLLNAYGYWEAQGFGMSESNETGMPWDNVIFAITDMTQSPGGTDFGGPLAFQGWSYAVDLSQLPIPPDYYRLGGTSMSLLEIVSQICEDGACDYFVQLEGTTIVVRTVSRLFQPPLGTISALTNANWGGTVVRSYSGLETRNDITSSFLVGGEVTTLYLTDNILSFWGYDIDGFPILADDGTWAFSDSNGNVIQTIDDEFMDLNAAPISGVLGSMIYNCSTLEMRFAKVSYDAWATFIGNCRPDIAELLDLTCFIQKTDAGKIVTLKPDAVNDDKQNAQNVAEAILTDRYTRIQQVYEFVKGYADEFYGRKFVVGVPFVFSKIDPDTLQVINSYEPTDGGYLPEGSQPLGLDDLNEDILMNQDGRYRAFVEFEGLDGSDFSMVSPQGTVIQDDQLFVQCNPSQKLVFAPTPYVVITLQSPLTEEAVDSLGDSKLIEAMLGQPVGNLAKLFKNASIGIKVAPAARYPDAAAIPLKSNTMTYGPWYAEGTSGKVKFEYDPGLTPWGYGDWDTMDFAGTARVMLAITNMTVCETGSLELAGAPSAGLGDVLQNGGPNVTNIDVQVSKDGVTTTYRFATFTPRFGVFSKGMENRVRRIALADVQLRRTLRASLREDLANTDAIFAADRARRVFMQNASKPIKRESPHDTFVSWSCLDEESGDLRVGMNTATLEEAISFANADEDEEFKATAIMSLNGLLRPFSTDFEYEGPMACYSEPSGDFTSAMTVKDLDPWRSQNDIDIYAWGDSYDGINAYARQGDTATARPVCLRSPLVLSGWGTDVDTNWVPSTGNGNLRQDYLTRSDTWKVGPVDLLWDYWRGVWTPHGVIIGTSSGSIEPDESGVVNVWNEDEAFGWNLDVTNWGSNPIGTGDKVIGFYIPQANGWYTYSLPSGYTGTIDIVTDTYCSGNQLVTQFQTFTWQNGLLISAS